MNNPDEHQQQAPIDLPINLVGPNATYHEQHCRRAQGDQFQGKAGEKQQDRRERDDHALALQHAMNVPKIAADLLGAFVTVAFVGNCLPHVVGRSSQSSAIDDGNRPRN